LISFASGSTTSKPSSLSIVGAAISTPSPTETKAGSSSTVAVGPGSRGPFGCVPMAESRLGFGVVFPVNMGNRGQNVLFIPEVFRGLVAASHDIEFVGYHWRISGNFVFRYRADAEIEKAAAAAKGILGLKCLARSFSHLANVDSAVPSNAKVVKTSVVVQTPVGQRRVVFVGLSGDVATVNQIRGILTPKIELIAWPSARDVLCLYNRLGEAGDVGQVTQAVEKRINKTNTELNLYGTGRALSVIRDLLGGRYERG